MLLVDTDIVRKACVSAMDTVIRLGVKIQVEMPRSAGINPRLSRMIMWGTEHQPIGRCLISWSFVRMHLSESEVLKTRHRNGLRRDDRQVQVKTWAAHSPYYLDRNELWTEQGFCLPWASAESNHQG
jgi:hypothetical protein